jgi:hypothetical protein
MKGSECFELHRFNEPKLTKSEVIENEYTSEYYEKGVQKIDTSQLLLGIKFLTLFISNLMYRRALLIRQKAHNPD